MTQSFSPSMFTTKSNSFVGIFGSYRSCTDLLNIYFDLLLSELRENLLKMQSLIQSPISFWLLGVNISFFLLHNRFLLFFILVPFLGHY